MEKDYILSRKRDQFYTQESVAQECLEYLKPYIKNNTLFIEPSAGMGAFISALKKEKLSYLAFDIEPKHTEIKEQDFLTLNTDFLKNEKGSKIVIGNPPFGKNAKLAIEFFNHSAQFADMIGMIFPATFEKESVQKRLNKKMHLVKTIVLSDNKFIFMNKLHSVPTVFQIWIKKEEDRANIDNKLISEHFQFVKKEDANFAIQRVGVAAGKVKVDIEKLPVSSHYFIKANEEIKDLISQINWNSVKHNTAGNPSISKRELIMLLEKEIKK